MKRCGKCKRDLPLEQFSRDARRKDGLRWKCRECCAEAHQRRMADPDMREKLRGQSRKSYYANHEKALASAKRWRDANPEKRKTAVRRWKDEHRDEVRDYQREYAGRNRERIRQKQKEWLERNRESYARWANDYNLRRQRRLRDISDPARPISRFEIAERDSWRCHICGGKVTQRDWTIDHLVPVSKGGLNVPENVALAHRVCNSRRGAGRLPAQLRII